MARYTGRKHGFYFTSQYKHVRDLEIEELEIPVQVKTLEGRVCFEINTKGKLVVYPGYSHDGCSPLIWSYSSEWYGVKFGTPDGIGDKLEGASRTHDALYQLFREDLLPKGFGLHEANAIFDEDMRRVGFLGRPIYTYAVSITAKLTYRYIAKGKPNNYIIDALWVDDMIINIKSTFTKVKAKLSKFKKK